MPVNRGAGMIALVVRLLLIVGGAIAGWFFEKDQPNFSVIQMAIAVLLLVFFVFVIGFWPRNWFQPHSTHKAKTK
jgi:membrane protein YdbS with pleckstrin-like domain